MSRWHALACVHLWRDISSAGRHLFHVVEVYLQGLEACVAGGAVGPVPLRPCTYGGQIGTQGIQAILPCLSRSITGRAYVYVRLGARPTFAGSDASVGSASLMNGQRHV